MPEPADYPARVRAAVARIPSGYVMSYGDVAEYADIRSARSVGKVLGNDSDGVPWHRVVFADGSLSPHLYERQRSRLLAEGVRFIDHRVDVAAHRWDGR